MTSDAEKKRPGWARILSHYAERTPGLQFFCFLFFNSHTPKQVTVLTVLTIL